MPIPKPSEITGIEKWTDWRPGQPEAVTAIANWLGSDRPVLALTAPAGSGKTVLAAAAAGFYRPNRLRVAILTPRKNLQRQMRRDMRSVATNLYGRIEYKCPSAQYKGESGSAADAACAKGRSRCFSEETPARQIRIDAKDCPVRQAGECPYYTALELARQSRVVVGNYALWQSHQQSDESPFAGVQMVICDEAHLLQQEMTSGQTIEFTAAALDNCIDTPTPLDTAAQAPVKERRDAIIAAGKDIPAWQAWAADVIALRLDPEMAGSPGEKIGIETLNEGARKLAEADPDNIIAWHDPESVIQGGGRFGQRLASFRGAAVKILPIAPRLDGMVGIRAGVKALLLSATISPAMLEHLGLRPDDSYFHEVVPTWDPDRSPISQHPDAAPMTWKALQEAGAKETAQAAWLAAIDERFHDALLFLSNANRYVYSDEWGLTKIAPERWGRIQYNMDSQELEVALEAHAAKPGILASASISVGYDFPDDLARSIVIPKIPYPPLGDPLVEARKAKLGNAWYDWETIAAAMQMCGRGMRSESDWCQTVVTDSGWDRFIGRTKRYQPAWFRQRILAYAPYHQFRGLWATEPIGVPGTRAAGAGTRRVRPLRLRYLPASLHRQRAGRRHPGKRGSLEPAHPLRSLRTL